MTTGAPLDRRSRTPLERARDLLRTNPTISPLLVLLVAGAVAGGFNPRFAAPGNLSLVFQQVAMIAALGVGQTLIVLTAGIDLSVGAMMILVAVVMGQLVAGFEIPGIAALLVGLLLAALCGFANGWLVVRLRLPPFIATLGTLNVFTALALLISQGASINADQLGDVLNWTATSFSAGPFRLTTGVLVMLAMYAVIGFVLHQTAWGRHVYAVGDDSSAAMLAGIDVRPMLMSVYVVAGVLVGLSSWVLIGRVGAATVNSAIDANLDSITAVVIGGTSLFGGRGRLIGTLLGALIVGVFRNGLSIARVDVLYQTLAIGLLVIVAVALDQWIRRTDKKR